MGKNPVNHLEPIITYEKLPVRFFRSGDYGSFIPFHYHPAIELILLTKGKLKVEIPDQATSHACMKCAIPAFPAVLPKSISELKQTKLVFSDPMPTYEADLPNQCSLNAQGANLVLINSNELHNSSCTSYNEAYVLQIPESFLESELNYDSPMPLRFDLKRASLTCLEQMAQYLLELTVAHEYCQGELGFKVHFNHGLYGILSCLMEMIIPNIQPESHLKHKVALGSNLKNKCLAQQHDLKQHADVLLEKEPVNALPGSTTLMMPSINDLSSKTNAFTTEYIIPDHTYYMVLGDNNKVLQLDPYNQEKHINIDMNLDTKLYPDNNSTDLSCLSLHGVSSSNSSDLSTLALSTPEINSTLNKVLLSFAPANKSDANLNNQRVPYSFSIDDEDDDFVLTPSNSKETSKNPDQETKVLRRGPSAEQLEAEAKVAIALNKNMNLRRIQPVLDYLKVHYHEQIKLQDMADLINLHPRYFCRVFKDAVGMSLLSYVAELRLCHIYNDLTETKTLISTIMRRHGYSDHKQFYRSFKARFKVTPKEVRAMLKSNQDPTPKSHTYFERYSSEYHSKGHINDQNSSSKL